LPSVVKILRDKNIIVIVIVSLSYRERDSDRYHFLILILIIIILVIAMIKWCTFHELKYGRPTINKRPSNRED